MSGVTKHPWANCMCKSYPNTIFYVNEFSVDASLFYFFSTFLFIFMDS